MDQFEPAGPGRPGKHRGRIVRAAAELFRLRGYNATGTADIVALSGAPKGSLYHFFPGGKEEVARAALDHAGQVAAGSMQAIAAATAAERLRAYGGMLAAWMEQSGCRQGCPIATTVLELAPESPAVAEIAARAFRSWSDIFVGDLLAEAVCEAEAARLARLAIAALEGALLVARAEGTAQIITDCAGQVASLFEAAPRKFVPSEGKIG